MSEDASLASRGAKTPRGRNGGESNAKLRKSAGRRLPTKAGWRPIQKAIKLASGMERVQDLEEAWIDARHLVRHYVAMGYTKRLICQLMAPPINEEQLNKYFDHELEHGLAIQNARVGAVAFQMATSGQDGTMTRFWLRSRAGWQDAEDGGSTGPVKVRMIDGDDTI